MRFKEFKVEGEYISDSTNINDILISNNLKWLIDAEIENAEIEIKNKTAVWKNGIFYTGNWNYGIWKNGDFYGIWENGIWENGNFKGKWESGIDKTNS